MSYIPTLVANNILARSFKEENFISPMKLQKILYFVASEYQKLTGRTLLEELFGTWKYGPVLYSVYNKFRRFGPDPIKRYARDAAGEALMVRESDDPYLCLAIHRVWNTARHRSAITLVEITRYEGSAWYKAHPDYQRYLDPEDIKHDTTYLEPLGITPLHQTHPQR